MLGLGTGSHEGGGEGARARDGIAGGWGGGCSCSGGDRTRVVVRAHVLGTGLHQHLVGSDVFGTGSHVLGCGPTLVDAGALGLESA